MDNLDKMTVETLKLQLEQAQTEIHALSNRNVLLVQEKEKLIAEANKWSDQQLREQYNNLLVVHNKAISELCAEHDKMMDQITLKVDTAMIYEDKKQRLINIPYDDRGVQKLVKEYTPSKSATESVYNQLFQRVDVAKVEEEKAKKNLADAEKKLVWRIRRRMAFEIVLENVSPEVEELREINRQKKKIDGQIKALNDQKRRMSSSPLTPTSKAFQPKKRRVTKSNSESSLVPTSSSSTASTPTTTKPKLSTPKFLGATHEDPLKEFLVDTSKSQSSSVSRSRKALRLTDSVCSTTPTTTKIAKRIIDSERSSMKMTMILLMMI